MHFGEEKEVQEMYTCENDKNCDSSLSYSIHITSTVYTPVNTLDYIAYFLVHQGFKQVHAMYITISVCLWDSTNILYIFRAYK